jgi:hypothetical protein
MKMQRDKEGELRTLLHFEPTDLIDAKCRLWQVAEKHPKGYIVDPTIKNIIEDLNTREE